MPRVLLTFLGLVAVVSCLMHVFTAASPSQRFAMLRRANRRLMFVLSVLGIVFAAMFMLANLDSFTN